MTVREMQRVREGRRQVMVHCPGCLELVGLWLCVLPPGEYERSHNLTDVTASLVPPERRAEAMRTAAEMSDKATAVPWVSCTSCGYDGHYVFGAPT